METNFPKWDKNWMFNEGTPLAVPLNIGIHAVPSKFTLDSVYCPFHISPAA